MGKKKKGRSTQELMGIQNFTRYGLATNRGELLFFLVSPTNISVLSHTNIEIKIRHLMMVLSAIPDIEITCTDSCECFDDNQAYLRGRLQEEGNPLVRQLLEQDREMLDRAQAEMATARQFLFISRCKGMKADQVFQAVNRIEKVISEQGFEVRRMRKSDIKRFLAIYFDASMNGDQMPDTDGRSLSVAGTGIGMNALRLLQQTSQILQNEVRPVYQDRSVDRKLRRKINEKKQAQGLRQ